MPPIAWRPATGSGRRDEFLDQAAGHGGGDQGVVGRDGTDRGEDLLQRHVLDQEAAVLAGQGATVQAEAATCSP